jgi:uncharacterized protein DUF4160
MPRICSFYGIAIWIYWNDHHPAHFHPEYGDFEVLIKIEDLSVYSGALPSRALGLVIEWASQHTEELMENWLLAERQLPLKKIAPLK